MTKVSRVEQVMKNMLAGTLAQLVSLLMAFITRTVFIHTLNIEYLGVNGLFTNILIILSFAELGIGTDIVMKVAEVNMEILMSTQYEDADICTSDFANDVLKGKVLRSGVSKSITEGFSSLLELNNIPDISLAVSSKSIDMDKIFNIRDKRISREFRKWLQTVDPQDARDLEKAFVQSIGKEGVIGSLPAKVLRFLIVTGLGFANPILGAGAGITDSLFVEKWFEGYSPKLFIDELAKIKRSS